MSNVPFNQLTAAVRGAFDRRTAGGVFIGVAVMLSAIALADTSTPSTPSYDQMSTAVNAENAKTQAEIDKELADCGKNGIGKAIKDAMDAHGQLAAATPNVESLFDINGDCFSSISQIVDLSSSIPSLDSIMAGVTQALQQYAQKKVCTAVNKVTGLVTSPINQAIGTINQMAGFADINGMANTAVGGAMASIDPDLGSAYHSAAGGTYNVQINPFNATQTTFDGSLGGGGTLAANTGMINALTQQLGAQLIKVNQSKMKLDSAQNAYNSCASDSDNNCTAAYSAVTQAQAQFAADQAVYSTLQTQLGNVVNQGAQTPTAAATSQAKTTPSQTTLSTTGNWWSGVTNLFN